MRLVHKKSGEKTRRTILGCAPVALALLALAPGFARGQSDKEIVDGFDTLNGAAIEEIPVDRGAGMARGAGAVEEMEVNKNAVIEEAPEPPEPVELPRESAPVARPSEPVTPERPPEAVTIEEAPPIEETAPEMATLEEPAGPRPPNRPILFAKKNVTRFLTYNLEGLADPFTMVVAREEGGAPIYLRANERGFFTMHIPLKANKQHKYWVWAYNSKQVFSKAAPITIVNDVDPPPVPKLCDLSAATSLEQIRVYGNAERNSTVVVRGGAYETWSVVDDLGNFDMFVPLRVGANNSLAIKALDKAMNASKTVLVKIKQVGEEDSGRLDVQ